MTRENVGVTDAAHTPDYYAKNHFEDVYKLMEYVEPSWPTTRSASSRNCGGSGIWASGITLRRSCICRSSSLALEPAVRDEITDEALWVELEHQAGGVGAMERELRDTFQQQRLDGARAGGPDLHRYGGEDFRDHRNDAAFDFGPVVGNLATKALRWAFNAVLAHRAPRGAGARAAAAAFNGHTVDVLGRMPLTLGQFLALAGEQALNAAITHAAARELVHRRAGGGGGRGGARPESSVRRHRVGREAAMIVRNQLVGVGCQGAPRRGGAGGVRLGNSPPARCAGSMTAASRQRLLVLSPAAAARQALRSGGPYGVRHEAYPHARPDPSLRSG